MTETPHDETEKTGADQASTSDAPAVSPPKSADEQSAHDREQELLDEGLEETFPASDPVSAKHIT